MAPLDSTARKLPGEPAPPYRAAPHNIEAEQALLGAILVNNEALYRVGMAEFQRGKWDNAITVFDKLTADLPAREIVDSVEPAGAQVLVLGLTTAAADKARERELKTIVRELPDGVELWAGGRGAERHASIIRPRGLILSDYNTYQQELVRLGGRLA